MTEDNDHHTLEDQIYKGSFIVLNDKGLHARPSTELVKCATQFHAEIVLTSAAGSANAKSILGVLMLAAVKDTSIEVEAKGDDAKEALEALLELAASSFNMSY